MRRILITVLVALAVVLAGCASDGGSGNGASVGGNGNGNGASGGGGQNVGVSAGGAQDANVFRTNIEEGYVPQPTDVVPEGLYHDYYFDTNLGSDCAARFCAAYDRAVSEDPLSGEREQFMAVGLNSGITQAELQREKLNLIVVLDVSGSMDSPFAQYYYDGDERREVESDQRKIEAATDAVSTLTEKLGADDRFALVTYEDSARVEESMRRMDERNRDALRERIDAIETRGGTNLAAGMDQAASIAESYPGDGENRSTRIVYVTDAMPNIGDTSTGGLGGQIQHQAQRDIHTTFVGVGVDFNTRLTNALADVRGANYYSVHSPSAFESRMDEGFTYMTTPLAHDLSLTVAGDGYEVENVYGAPGEAGDGELLSVSTLFPSRSEGDAGEGSVILVEFDREGDAADREVQLTASYETPNGEVHERTKTVTFADQSAPYYESTGVRKAVVLTRYASLMQNWAAHERAMAAGEDADVPDGVESRERNQWEQTSLDLTVTEPYDQRISEFRQYFQGEMEALGADRMQQDLDILTTLTEQDG